ncbi:unnamed protein product [Miscanthus lutarioriparius]|uniref:Uncharacterized protein n=1 Tax=Miscanthus lutarioriparius TaxID=422564 RepID=A0A811R3A9_9POAL|nr:unnamed protein product [Miscanthus lutarioriparius]
MGHCQQHVLVAITLMAASILQGVSSTAITTTKLPRYAVTTAYDVLEQNNLPQGLFPLGIQSYELNAGGAFEVTLPGECNFFVTFAENKIKFRFDSSVSGTIKSGSLSRLSGAKILVEFALRGFNQVNRAGNLLNFHLENSIVRSFPASAFAQSVNCSGLLAA